MSSGSGLDTKQRSAFEAVVKCDQSALDADSSHLQTKGGHPDSELAEKLEEGYIFLRVRSAHH